MTELYFLSHPYKDNPERNVARSIEITNKLMDAGYVIFNPLAYTHEFHKNHPRDEEYWYWFDQQILEKCDGIILCDGWLFSAGCKDEFEVATRLNKKIMRIEEFAI